MKIAKMEIAQKYEVRQNEAKPILDDIYKWLIGNDNQFSSSYPY